MRSRGFVLVFAAIVLSLGVARAEGTPSVTIDRPADDMLINAPYLGGVCVSDPNDVETCVPSPVQIATPITGTATAVAGVASVTVTIVGDTGSTQGGLASGCEDVQAGDTCHWTWYPAIVATPGTYSITAIVTDTAPDPGNPDQPLSASASIEGILVV